MAVRLYRQGRAKMKDIVGVSDFGGKARVLWRRISVPLYHASMVFLHSVPQLSTHPSLPALLCVRPGAALTQALEGACLRDCRSSFGGQQHGQTNYNVLGMGRAGRKSPAKTTGRERSPQTGEPRPWEDDSWTGFRRLADIFARGNGGLIPRGPAPAQRQRGDAGVASSSVWWEGGSGE